MTISNVKKLTRLLNSQMVVESQAQQAVIAVSGELAQIEKQIEAAQNSVASSDMAMLFSDLYLGHQLKLIDQKAALEIEVQAAAKALQLERLKSKRIGERLKQAQYLEQRYIDELLTLEQLDRGNFVSQI